MPSISPILRTIIWVLTGIASTSVTILLIILDKNIKYLLIGGVRKPTDPPRGYWLMFGISVFVAIAGAAFASSAPDYFDETKPTVNIISSSKTLTPLHNITENSGAIVPTSTPTLLPTPIPTGDVLRNLKFVAIENGYCNGSPYDHLKVWGYDYPNGFEQFFLSPQGYFYIIACGFEHKPQESIQITANVVGDSKSFGYGVLLGWTKKEGWSSEKMNYCGFGVRTDGTATYGKFSETIDGEHSQIPEIPIDWMVLDTKVHTVRFVILPNREAVGYLDNKYVGQHTFASCNEGEMGFYATGSGNTKIFFDDLILTGLSK